MRHYKQKLISILRLLPFLLLLAAAANYLIRSRSLSVEDIVNYTPENLYLAALVMLALFAVKSATVFFPLSVLYLACGVIFPTPAALGVSALGLFVSLSIPYCIGRLLGAKMVNKLLTKYEKTKELQRFRTKNEWLFAYILRAVKILPADLVSMFLGAEKMNFMKYLAGSFGGLVPTLISTIAMGSAVSDPSSASFVSATVITIVFTILPLALYPFVMKKERRVKQEQDRLTDES